MSEMEKAIDTTTYIARVHVLLSHSSLIDLRGLLTGAKRTRLKTVNFTLNGSASLIPRKMAVQLIESHIKLKGGQ